MSMGTAFNVALGLVLTYLLLGMLASSFQELIVGAISLRGKKLLETLDRLLCDNLASGDAASLAAKIKTHALVKPLGTAEKPSYLPAMSMESRSPVSSPLARRSRWRRRRDRRSPRHRAPGGSPRSRPAAIAGDARR